MPSSREGHRNWGDGATSQLVHVIESVSYARGVIACRDGTAVTLGSHLTLEEAWEAHKGSRDFRPSLPQAEQMASDAEVGRFLDAVGGGQTRSRVARASIRHTAPSMTDDAVEEAFEWLARVQEMQKRCTCATTELWDCPNYVEGDEDA